MPILLWPFPSGVGPPPVLVRAPDGKVFVINSLTHDFFGPSPYLNESCVMVLYPTGPGIPHSPLQFTFIDPTGVAHDGDPNFAFVSNVPIKEIFPTQTLPVGSFVYTFGLGELATLGRWTVKVTSGPFTYQSVTFVVYPIDYTVH
jgi:hypothetical protein